MLARVVGPAHHPNVVAPGKVDGTASHPDGSTLLAGVDVTIEDLTTSQFYNGTSFVSSATPLTVTAQGASAQVLEAWTRRLADDIHRALSTAS